MDSSTAELPPPMTTTSLSRYWAPSQMAHQLMPDPAHWSSPGTPSRRGTVPVARITALAW